MTRMVSKVKKINIPSDKIKQIKKQHLNYCSKVKSIENQNIDPEIQKLLFQENPFDSGMLLKSEYNNLGNFDFIAEYEKFRKAQNKKKWCGCKLIEEIGISNCPYCGIHYFSTVKKDNKVISEATLDHYYPKNAYPFLALNVYNLIPVCKNCNSSFKTISENLLVHPFFDSLEDNIKFKTYPDEIIEYLTGDNTDIKLSIDILNISVSSSKWELTDAHIRDLWLKERYEGYQGITKSIIKKKIFYNKSYLKELEEYDERLRNCDIKTLLLCKDIFSDNEPFSKFSNDIWDDINV